MDEKNYVHYNMWDEMIYPFTNFNSASTEVLEWMNNFTPHITMHVINNAGIKVNPYAQKWPQSSNIS